MKKFNEPIYVTRPLLPDTKKVQAEIEKIWQNKWLTNQGPNLTDFELRLEKFLGVKNVIVMNNGTTALMCALKALGRTGEVITTPFTFAATTNSILWQGLTPVFADVDENTLNINPKKIEKLITPKTVAILPVHVFGNACDVLEIDRIAKKHRLKVIYDAAHAFGTEIDGNSIASFGDMSVFSFHSTKLFHSLEGGAVATNNDAIAKILRLLRNFGISDEEHVDLCGINGKMNEVQAAIGLLVLDMVEEEKKKRKLIKKYYEDLLNPIEGIDCIKNCRSSKNSYQYFVIRIKESGFGSTRDNLYNELRRYNIFARKYFYPLCSNYPFLTDNPSAKRAILPVANKISEEVLALPYYGSLALEDVENICQVIKHVSNEG